MKSAGSLQRIYDMKVSTVWPLYVKKLERKGRSADELNSVALWLTGFSQQELDNQIALGASFKEFFERAQLNPNARLITGVVCGVRVEDIEDPLMQRVRYLDKLVDELAKGRVLDKVLRV